MSLAALRARMRGRRAVLNASCVLCTARWGRTRSVSAMRSSVHCSRNFSTAPSATAASTPADQNSCDTASTAIAGHSTAHCARGLEP